jgi:hypothetical protein
VREFGVAVGLLYAADRALRSLSRHAGLYPYEFLAQPVDGKPLLPERLTGNLTARLIGQNDPALERMPARSEIKAGRYRNGARCIGVERDGTLLGYIWLSFQPYAEDEVRCTYELPAPAAGAGPAGVFDFDLYVFPEHRMGIAFAAIWHMVSAYLHGQGVHHSFSRMTRFNTASRRAHLRLGSKPVGGALFVRLGAIELMLSTLRPWAAITWRRNQRVHLRLRAPRAG